MQTHPAINMHQVMLLSALLCPSVCHFTLTFTADGVCGNYLCAHLPSLFVGILVVFHIYVSDKSGKWEKSLTLTSTVHRKCGIRILLTSPCRPFLGWKLLQ